MFSSGEKFVNLGRPNRVWAIAAIHGDRERLMALHDHIAARFSVRDRLVYLGNYLGHVSYDNQAVIEELLAFRCALLAKPGMEPSDIIHLRGPAEEAWQRLLRLQFSPAPSRAVGQYLEAGAEAYLRLYGVSLNETRSLAHAGSVAITRWTNQLRVLQREAPGHEAFMSSMRRAAITAATEEEGAWRALFVPAGYDVSRSLNDQGDALWFGNTPFNNLSVEHPSVARIVRGYDPHHAGVQTEGMTVTLDGGCERGGPLVCGCFDASGKLLEIVTMGGKSAVQSSHYDAPQAISTAPRHVTMPAAQKPTVPEQPIEDEPTFWSMQAAQ